MENDQVTELLEFGLNQRLSNVSFDDIEKKILAKTQDQLLTEKVIKLLKKTNRKDRTTIVKVIAPHFLLVEPVPVFQLTFRRSR